jgi:general stress protein 26
MEDVLHPNLIEDIEKLGSLIKDIKVAMLTTVDEKGRMHSRPMMTQQVEFDGDLWFLTSASSHKMAELNWNRQVHLTYASAEKNRFISVTGTGQIIRDPHRAKQLWSPLYRAWFPKGLSDPDLVLLKVEVDQAEYWEATSTTVAQVIGFAKAVATGKRHKGEATEHKKIDLAG